MAEAPSFSLYVTFHGKTYTNENSLNGQKVTTNKRVTNNFSQCSNNLVNELNDQAKISNDLQKHSNEEPNDLLKRH